MVAMVLDSHEERRLIRRRRRLGIDLFDEVWDGVYIVPAPRDNQHQELLSDLSAIIQHAVDFRGLGRTVGSVKVSDRADNWMSNFRIPDLNVFLSGCSAVDCGAFWFGGPDFVLEISSKGDQTDEKLPFYAKVNTTEVLLIDRDPWMLRLFRRIDQVMQLAESGTPDEPVDIHPMTIPLVFRLELRERKPVLQVTHRDGEPTWTIHPRDLPPKRRNCST